MAWYKTGTIAIANGSPALTGTGTDFVSNVQAGHGVILPDGRTYEVLTVNSATSITLSTNYQGTTVASGGAYLIVPTQGFAQAAAAAVAQLITDYQAIATGVGAGKFGDGTVSAPGVTFSADQDTGLYRPGANALSLALGGADYVRFTTSGVGFGTTSPAARVEISGANLSGHGQFQLTGSDVVQQTYYIGATQHGQIFHDASKMVIGTVSATPIVFRTGSTEYARIDPTAGDLIIGDTASTSGINLVRSGATSAELKLKQTGASGRDFRLSSTGSGYGSAGNLIIYDATAGAERFCLNAAGGVGFSTSSLTGVNLRLGKAITGSTTGHGILVDGTIQSDVTSTVYVFRSIAKTAAASFTLGGLVHFAADPAAFGAGSAVTSQFGFLAETTLTGGTNNFSFRANDTSAVGSGKTSTGFYSAIDIATGGGTTRAFHGAGTAPNVFRGKTRVGGTSDPSVELDVTGDVAASGTVKPGSYTVGTVPSASGKGAGATIYVSNESGGAVLAFSDATNWRRVTDRAIIS